MENAPLFANLVVAILVALAGALVASRLRQSVILGYIVGGMVISPFTPGIVGDVRTIEQLADLGVALLMFSIGVEVSLGDLRRAGRAAVLGSAAQVAVMVFIGYVVGRALGWKVQEALFLGAVVSISSGVTFMKTLRDRGEQDAKHGRVSIAWSSVQDLSTIVMVAALSALASPSGSNVGLGLLTALGKAAVFLALTGFVGSRLLSWAFERIAALRSRELFIIVTAAVALGMAYLASLFGLSLALGAFVAGLIVSESDLSHHIVGEITPLRDVFAALFFVSVGMLLDPVYLVHHLPLVLVALALIVVGKGLVSTGLAALARYPLPVAGMIGLTLAQSGEFSFVLARLGTSLSVISEGGFNLMLAGSVVSMALFPLMYSGLSPVVRRLEKLAPTPELAELPEAGEPARLHAVICGYGRVGQVIGAALLRRGFRFVVIEEDADIVRRARDQGIPAILGSASNPAVLEKADLAHARVLVVATPDAVANRLIVDYGQSINPRMEIVVRTHSWEEREYMYRKGITQTVMGELELALEMTRYTLHRFGVSGGEIQAILQGLRSDVDLDRPGMIIEPPEEER